MEYDVLEARYVSGFTSWLRFRDGRSGEVDLTHAMNGPVFEPLHDVECFRRFREHPKWETLVWPNGADMAPEFLSGARARRSLMRKVRRYYYGVIIASNGG